MPIYTTLQQNNQSGIAVAQNTDADNNLTVPDRTLNIGKLSLTAINELLTYSAVVGQAQDVANGIAQYTSIISALAAVPVGGTLLILEGTYTESPTISQEVHICGKGRGTVINGVLTISSNFSSVMNLKFGGNVTISGGATGNIISVCWLANTAIYTDNGTDTLSSIVQE